MVPELRHSFPEAQQRGALLGLRRLPPLVELGEARPDALGLCELVVPAAFELGRHQPIARVDRVVRRGGACRLVLELLELPRDRPPPRVFLDAQLLERLETRPYPKRGEDADDLFPETAADRRAPEAEAVAAASAAKSPLHR